MSTDNFDLTGKTALITGASRGLGQIFGRALARAGADLIVTSRKAADLTPFCHEIEAMGRQALPLELDVRDQYSIEAMCKAAMDWIPGAPTSERMIVHLSIVAPRPGKCSQIWMPGTLVAMG